MAPKVRCGGWLDRIAKTAFLRLRAANHVVRVIFLSILIAGSSRAQTGNQASLEGLAQDQSGAVVPGVKVSVRQLETGASWTSQTNEAGMFRFPALPVGTYLVRAERSGFATLVSDRIELRVGARVTLPLSFVVASQSADVTVRAEAPAVETSRSQVSATVDARSIASLPVNGRDFTSFVVLIPGVTTDVRGGLSFGGQRAMNSVLVDGMNADDNYWGQSIGGEGFPLTLGQSGYHLGLETMQEFQVNSNAYSAELGRAGGGVVNVVTRSGGDTFSGAAYEFYRDRSLNANTVVNNRLGLPKDAFHFNQFGGVVGGPIARRRLSFFAGYDSVRSDVSNGVSLNLPPGFQLSADSATATSQRLALDYLGARASSWSFPFQQDDWLAKLDWQATAAHAFSVRWTRQRADSAFPGFPQQSRENALPVGLSLDAATASFTSTFSGSLVNVARFAYASDDSPFRPVAATPMAEVFEQGALVLTIGQRPAAPQDIRNDRVQFADTLSWLRGRHLFKTGVDVLVDRMTYFTAQNFAGWYRFLSLASFGDSLAGTPHPGSGEWFRQTFSGFATPGVTTHPDTDEYAAFIQDEWRVTPALTFNAGLRYDLQLMAAPAVRNPSPVLAEAGLDTSFRPIDGTNLAPRLGLAWSPGARGDFVVRAGYGVFYAPTPSALAARAHFVNGISAQPLTFAAQTAAAALIPSYPNSFCGPVDPSGVPPSCAPPAAGAGNPSLMLFSPGYREPRTRQASAGVEFSPRPDLAVSIGYEAVRGRHLQWVRDINLAGPTMPATIGLANTTTRLTYQRYTSPRPLAGFDRVFIFDSGGESAFDGLTVHVNKRFSANHQFSLSYTLSKTTDDNPNVYAFNPGGGDSLLLSDPLNPEADRSLSVNDRRHCLVVSGLWQLNYTDGLPPLAKAILGGWSLAGIATGQSGSPYSAMVNADLNHDGNPQTDRTPGQRRNTFSLPALVSVDVRVARSLPLGGRRHAQLIVEAFNALNHANVTDVNNTQFAVSAVPAACGIAGIPCLVPLATGPVAFGTPTATAGPRIVQLGLKVVF